MKEEVDELWEEVRSDTNGYDEAKSVAAMAWRMMCECYSR